MYSVTGFIKQHKQPRGGYLPRKLFLETALTDEDELYPIEQESVPPTLMGLAVDYVSRLHMGLPTDQAFDISLQGARIVHELAKADGYIQTIQSMDLHAISLHEAEAVFNLVRYDTAYRAGYFIYHQSLMRNLIVTQKDVHNLQVMTNRTARFLTDYGPVTSTGATFEGGYTSVVSTGDMDFIANGVLWDLKVSKNVPDKNQTMQLLCYYILGKESIHNVFQSVQSIGIFNPRLHLTHTLDMEHVPLQLIQDLRTQMGYPV